MYPETRSREHKIFISTDQGDFTYKPSTLHAIQEETVTWICREGPFAISFQDQTPFRRISYSSERQGNQHIVGPLDVQQNRIGHHHYMVALTVSHGRRTPHVILDSGCPDIVVSDKEK